MDSNGASLGGVWACIRQRESSDNYADNTGNGYYGAYQFLEATWLSLGGTGYPNQAPPAVQDAMAQELQQRSGWGQWSTAGLCGV
ncbi:MAG: transglycosylase family protein [Acidimicrobiales bacterium]